MASLLPYLESGADKFSLKLSLISQDRSVLEKSPFPFLIISESEPISRLLEAQIVTDTGSEIKRVFLLLQKDDYHLTSDELRPVTNMDIEHSWQRAFSLYSKNSSSANQDAGIIFESQISKDGKLAPLQSLFYCKQKNVFFHPLCPSCGHFLQQCQDDDLLASVGLRPYSTSLKRYLFCPLCFNSTGRSDFYVYALETCDPFFVKDRRALIKAFAYPAKGKTPSTAFPCPNCPDLEECYGPAGLADSRIVPVSFYPFYMLIYEAGSINALDFLSLISGAEFEALEDHLTQKQEPGRIRCLKTLKEKGPGKTPFFFGKTHKKFFLEVLYLKLSFLSRFSRMTFSRISTYQYPDLGSGASAGLSLGRIWVKLWGRGGLLPFYWNFDLKLFNLGQPESGTTSFPKFPPAYALHFLGMVWFYTLLANKNQSVSQIYAALGEQIEKISSKDHISSKTFEEETINPVFSPENIFWTPRPMAVDQNWERLWKQSLTLGWYLIEAGLASDSKWSTDEFHKELESLRQGVRDSLLHIDSTPAKAQPLPENKALHDILTRIMNKWRLRFEALAEEEEMEELEKTVVLTPKERPMREKTTDISEDDEEITKTLIISPDDFEKNHTNLLQDQAQEVDETAETKKRHPEPEKDDFLAETVILYPKKPEEPEEEDKPNDK